MFAGESQYRQTGRKPEQAVPTQTGWNLNEASIVLQMHQKRQTFERVDSCMGHLYIQS